MPRDPMAAMRAQMLAQLRAQGGVELPAPSTGGLWHCKNCLVSWMGAGACWSCGAATMLEGIGRGCVPPHLSGVKQSAVGEYGQPLHPTGVPFLDGSSDEREDQDDG